MCVYLLPYMNLKISRVRSSRRACLRSYIDGIGGVDGACTANEHLDFEAECAHIEVK